MAPIIMASLISSLAVVSATVGSNCEADAARPFAKTFGADHISKPLDSFDCSRSASARDCTKNLQSNCECLSKDCYPSVRLLEVQSDECKKQCQDPFTSTICPDYDDENTYCVFWSVFHCVAVTAPSCDGSKLEATQCQIKCTAQPSKSQEPSAQFDEFLQCLEGCEPSSDREAAADRLEKELVEA